MIRQFLVWIRQLYLRRELLPEERVILDAVRERYPEHPRDEIFFAELPDPLLPVKAHAVLQVWDNGKGPWIDLTNLAGFMVKGGMTLQQVKEGFINDAP